MDLKSVHWRCLANRISLFALNSQYHWLKFASFGNLSVSFRSFTKLEKTYPRNFVSQKFPWISWILWLFWLKIYFELKEISQIFERQFPKPILKHVKWKFIVHNQHFYEQLGTFSKTESFYGLKILRGTFKYKLCPKNSLRPLNIKNTQKMTISSFRCISRKKLKRKRLQTGFKFRKIFFAPKVIISNSYRDIDV